MKEVFKNIGGTIIGIGFFVAAIFIVIFLIRGGLWLSDKLLPLFSKISGVLFIVFIIILLPLAIFKKTRGFSGGGMVVISYVFGATLWMWSFLLTYVLWGVFALIVGLFIMGIGIVPIALLATAFKGMWSIFGQLVLLIFMVFGARALGIYLIAKHDDESY